MAEPETTVRTIVFPVKWPTCKDDAATLRKVAAECFRAATTISQETIRQILIQDSYVRQPGDAKLPKAPKVYTYQKGDKRYAGWSNTVCTIKREIQSRWQKTRFDVLWTGKAGIPSYRYPQPFPLNNRSWKIVQSTDRLIVQCILMGVDGAFPIELQLGPGQKRQLKLARRVHSGEIKQGSGKLYESGGRLMFAMCVHVPVEADKHADGTLKVFSDPNAFIVAENDTANRLWIVNAVRVREWISKHASAGQRIREDLKASKRLRTSCRQPVLDNWKVKQEKHEDRIKSFVEETSAQIVKYATGRRFAEIALDLSNQDYFRSFPWFQFENRIKQKAKQVGLRVTKWERNSGDRSQVASNEK